MMGDALKTSLCCIRPRVGGEKKEKEKKKKESTSQKLSSLE